ncbi:MAG: hypothetical protein ACO2OW_02465, partial [Minisyncoccia bacterium]
MKKILIGILLGLSLGISFSLFAWVNPSQNPPSGGGVLQTSNTGLTINTSTYFISGNVGIGTTNPASWTKLDVAGRITSRDSFFATQPSPWYALNAYYDGWWKYANDGVAAGITINNFAQGRTSIGVAPFGTAGSNISWIGAIHIDNSNGN